MLVPNVPYRVSLRCGRVCAVRTGRATRPALGMVTATSGCVARRRAGERPSPPNRPGAQPADRRFLRRRRHTRPRCLRLDQQLHAVETVRNAAKTFLDVAREHRLERPGDAVRHGVGAAGAEHAHRRHVARSGRSVDRRHHRLLQPDPTAAGRRRRLYEYRGRQPAECRPASV